MTVKAEGRQALFNARQFLVSLLSPAHTPGVPKAMRQEAARVLRHYPWGETPDELFTNALKLKGKERGETTGGEQPR